MASGLEVDPDGLRVAAASSDAIATSLTSAVPERSSTRPSSAGVSAVDAVLSSVQGHQFRRITGQATDLYAAASDYDGRDRISAENIAVTI